MTEVPVNSLGSMTSKSSHSEAKMNSMMPSIEVDNAPFQLTLEKLNGRNFRECVQSIKLVIDGKLKLGYPTGVTKKPTDVVLLQKWKSRKLHGYSMVDKFHGAVN